MAGSLNKVCLIGNVGKDPEIRNTQSGQKVANLSLATSESWTDKASGEKKERTEWHRVVVWGQLAEVIERFVQKGHKLYIEGQLQTRKWSDKDGVEKYSTEVVLQGFNATLILLTPRDGAGGAERRSDPASGGKASSGAYDKPGSARGGPNTWDDDIPF
jgi:single-strand DNA-binding protein